MYTYIDIIDIHMYINRRGRCQRDKASMRPAHQSTHVLIIKTRVCPKSKQLPTTLPSAGGCLYACCSKHSRRVTGNPRRRRRQRSLKLMPGGVAAPPMCVCIYIHIQTYRYIYMYT